MKQRAILLLLVSCSACASSEKRGAEPESVSSSVEVSDVAHDGERSQVRAIVDAALRKNGKLRGYGDLSVGLNELERENRVRISVQSDGYHVDIAPRSDQGHDFSFRVEPSTLELLDVTVGHSEPEPEPE